MSHVIYSRTLSHRAKAREVAAAGAMKGKGKKGAAVTNLLRLSYMVAPEGLEPATKRL